MAIQKVDLLESQLVIVKALKLVIQKVLLLAIELDFQMESLTVELWDLRWDSKLGTVMV